MILPSEVDGAKVGAIGVIVYILVSATLGATKYIEGGFLLWE